jgi:hypothetical protein
MIGGVDQTDHRARERGCVIALDDAVTGFDDNKRRRPYCIVGWEGNPPHTYAVSPRTSTGRRGVMVPAQALAAFDRDGRFVFRAYPAPAVDVEAAAVFGLLPDPYRTEVLENVNAIEFELQD